jgi:Flp pilus assembly protein TadG
MIDESRGRRRRRIRRRDDGGYAPVELALLVPVIGLLLVAVVAAGRLGVAREQVQQAAREAARAASLARSPGAAEVAARTAAADSLAGSPGSCPQFTLVLDTGGLAAPVGVPGRVTATITCRVPLADLVGLPLPAEQAMSATFAAPVDQFRGR